MDAYPTEDFEGTVAQIRLQPVVVQNVTTYGTVINVPNPQLKLKPGMTANLKVEIAKRSDVLRVPNAALRFRPSDGRVRRAQSGRAAGSAVRSAADAAAVGDAAQRRHRRPTPRVPRAPTVPGARPSGAAPAQSARSGNSANGASGATAANSVRRRADRRTPSVARA